MVTDCQAVVLGMQEANSSRTTGTEPAGIHGIWRAYSKSELQTTPIKVKSHISFEESVKRGTSKWHLGNERADWLAGEAAWPRDWQKEQLKYRDREK